MAPIQRVLGANDPVDARHELRVVGLHRDAIGNFAARVRRLGEILDEREGGAIKAGGADVGVWQRQAGGGVVDGARHALGLATGTVEDAEVARQRRGGGNVGRARGRALADVGLLQAHEEEELVGDELATEGATELVALEAVLARSEIVDGIDVAVADELEEVAVPAIGSGLGDRIDDAAWMQTVAGG